MHMHDALFHVIFGSDLKGTLELVHSSSVRLYSITQCPFLAGMMNCILGQTHAYTSGCVSQTGVLQNSVGPDTIKALFFLFLNVDMVLKEYVCDASNKKAFAAAMNIRYPPHQTNAKDKTTQAGKGGAQNKQRQEQLDALEKLHSWSMIGTRTMDAAKARRFFTVLHDKISKMWLQDEQLHASDLMQIVKQEYLVC